jgi:hypothetical protein
VNASLNDYLVVPEQNGGCHTEFIYQLIEFIGVIDAVFLAVGTRIILCSFMNA